MVGCWVDTNSGFHFHNSSVQPTGVRSLSLVAGADNKASATFKGKGADLDLPDPGSLVGPIDVQLRTTAGSLCFGATFSAPFLKDDSGILRDKSD
jgi:hypothetical protein